MLRHGAQVRTMRPFTLRRQCGRYVKYRKPPQAGWLSYCRN